MFSALVAFYSMRRFWWVVPFLWGYSLFIEVVQLILPHRSFAFLDIVANSIGLLGGALVIAPLRHWLIRLDKYVRGIIDRIESK
nr:VanZ family protein [Marinibactrum halimedae]